MTRLRGLPRCVVGDFVGGKPAAANFSLRRFRRVRRRRGYPADELLAAIDAAREGGLRFDGELMRARCSIGSVSAAMSSVRQTRLYPPRA